MSARPQFLFPDSARLGSDNVILHARARRHSVINFAGPLSIKTVVEGAVTWTVAGRELPVDRDAFLVLGDGERYSLEIDSVRPTETACAFFRAGFVEEIAQDIATSVESSLVRYTVDLIAITSGSAAARSTYDSKLAANES